MKPKLTILTNGLTIVSQKNPSSSMINIGIWVKVGSRHEDLSHNGLAHLCEHMIFKGTKTRSEIDINEQVADIGGNSEAWTTSNCTSFSLEVLNKDFEFAIELLADVILNAKFDEEDIKAEKKIILQEMFEDQNDDEDIFNDAFSKLIFGEQSLGRDILGTTESLKALTKSDLEEFRAKYYVASNMILSVAGNVNHNDIVMQAEKYFGRLPKGEAATAEPQHYIGGFKHLNPDSSKVMFRLGFDLKPNNKNNAAKVLMNQILGGCENSRLHTEVRVKRSLAYDIGCNLENEIDVGFVSITAEAQVKNINRILELTAKEICRMKSETVSEKELKQAKKQMIVALIKRSEENDSCYAVSAEQWINFGRLQSLEKLIQLIESVTTDDIKNAANEVFSSKLTYLIQGNINAYHNYERMIKLLS